MNDDGTVNGRIIDSTAAVATLMTGQAPSQSFGMLDTVMVETMAMAMYNAVTRQQNAGMVSSAAVTATCAKMLAVQPPPPPPSPLPPPAPLPVLAPLPGPAANAPPADRVAAAFANAETAINKLKSEASQAETVASTVRDDLSALIDEAQARKAEGSTPTPPSAPSAPPSPPSSGDGKTIPAAAPEGDAPTPAADPKTQTAPAVGDGTTTPQS